jgi:hypothetical protein
MNLASDNRKFTILSLPRTRIVLAAYTLAIFLINVAEILLHVIGGYALSRWLEFSESFLNFFIKLDPALYQVANLMRLLGYYHRIEIVQNIMLWNLILYLTFSGILCISITLDFKKGRNILFDSMKVWEHRIGRSPEVVFISNLFVTLCLI